MDEQELTHEAQKKAFLAALCKAQGSMEALLKGSINPGFKSKYANLAAVWDVIREPLAVNGLSVTQMPIDGGPDGFITLQTTIGHVDGWQDCTTFSMPVSKKDAQGYGSAITYAKRYVLLGVAGIAPEDDDGNAASGKAPSVQVTDYSGTVAEAKEQLAKCKTGPEARQLYSMVRGSSIGEPDKTSLLTHMKDFITKKWPS